MRNALAGDWSQQASFSTVELAPLHDLNLRFLDLIAAEPAARRDGGPIDSFQRVPPRVAPMSAPQRVAAARCPYSLFDLRFNDETHWHDRLQGAAPWRIADEPAAAQEHEIANFVRLALFYAWHVACTSRHAARVLLGMSERTAVDFGTTALATLPALVESEARHLTARFCDCGIYWSALATAAVRTDPGRLRQVQLFGLQLAAASLVS